MFCQERQEKLIVAAHGGGKDWAGQDRHRQVTVVAGKTTTFRLRAISTKAVAPHASSPFGGDAQAEHWHKVFGFGDAVVEDDETLRVVLARDLNLADRTVRAEPRA